MTDSVGRFELWKHLIKKVNHLLNKDHVLNIMILLFEELIVDLKHEKKIIIPNFGTLQLKKTKPRLYFNIVFQKLVKSNGFKLLSFDLDKKLKHKLYEYIDFEKTFGEK